MSTGNRRKWVLAAETALAVVIVAAVGYSFWNTLRDLDTSALELRVRPELLAVAGGLYLLAHLCWSTFWVRLLHHEGVRVSWFVGLRAYYISQFGKYVPGKVMVLFMRVGMLRPHGGHPIPVAVTATYETLTSMAAGALLGVLFLPALGVLPERISGNSTGFLVMGALPIGLAVLNKLAVRVAKKKRAPDARPLPAPSIFLLMQGLIHGACGYALLALSLGLTMSALVPDAAQWRGDAYEAQLSAVALAYVAGFVIVVAPGGLGAREFVLVAALTPALASAHGANAAGLATLLALALRLTWTVAEVIVGLILYAIKPAIPPHAHHHPPHETAHA
jgi:glycosyltransferase 2 family protein